MIALKKQSVNLLLAGGLALSAIGFVASPSFATAPDPATAAANSVAAATTTISAIDDIAYTALLVCLTPMGAMLTLRFLNMVLSRV